MASSGTAKFTLEIATKANLEGVNQVKAALQEIQTAASSGTGFASGKSATELNQMVTSARNLQYALTAAFDTKLGVVNLQKFNNALKTCGTDIVQIKNGLMAAGSQGQKAFLQMTSQILKVSNATRQCNTFVQKMSTTFLNTIRWQVTSSILNTMVGSFSKMYNYVKDLDQSLNNIQIVTQKSAESMQDFAKEANAAAQNLGTKTTTFTDAALIYYQQGLGDEEALARTETTVKMANVMGETASTVSDYMTAIWNNFEDGSHTVEYFADVITNLGAHTASSAEEIAEGLEKFASVANTVGLSYEYATSALATVVAQTRQSADTVGTAFKTLFARIQDLELGETLDDGTTLGTYSQALEKVGINIKDQSGELKDMNEILDEMGAKWQTLSKDQQVALAQNVAGTRQYTQLVALMDNWDTFNKNLETANDSEGRLAEEQDTYMESVKAHVQVLNAAVEDLYDSVLQTGAINGVLTAGTGIIKVITKIVDSLDGLKGILPIVGGLVLKAFGPKIADSILLNVQNLELERDKLNSVAAQYKIIAQLSPQLAATVGTNLQSGPMAAQNAVTGLINTYEKFQPLFEYMTAEEKEQYNTLLDQKATVGSIEAELEEMQGFSSGTNLLTFLGASGKNFTDLDKLSTKIYAITSAEAELTNVREAEKIPAISTNAEQDFDKYLNSLTNWKTQVEADFTKAGVDVTEFQKIWDSAMTQTNGKITGYNIEGLITKLKNLSATGKEVANLSSDFNLAKAGVESFDEALMEANLKFKQAVTSITGMISSFSMLASSIGMVSSIIKTMQNEDMSFGDKLISILTSSLMMLPIVINSLTRLGSGFKNLNKNLQAIVDRNTLADRAKNAETAAAAEIAAEEASVEAVAAGEKAKQAEIRKTEIAKEKARLQDKKRHFAEEEENAQYAAKVASLNSTGLAGGKTEAEWNKTATTYKEFQTRIDNEIKALEEENLALEQNTEKVIKNNETKTTGGVTAGVKTGEAASTGVDTIAETADAEATEAATKAKTEEQVVTEGLAEAKTENTIASTEEAGAEVIETVARKEDTKQTGKQAVAEGAETVTSEINGEQHNKTTRQLLKEIIVRKDLKGRLKELITGHWQEMVAIAAVIAAVVAISAAYKAYREHLEKVAENEKSYAESLTEVREELAETAESITSISEALDDLADQYGTENIEQFREELYESCIQYGNTQLAIEALTASYEELQKTIRETEVEADKKLQESAEQEAAQYEKSANSTLISEESGVNKFKKRVSTTTQTYMNSEGETISGHTINLKGIDNKDLKSDLASIGVSSMIGDTINMEDLIKVASTNRDELESVLRNSDSPAAEQILDYLNNTISEQLDAISTANDEAKEAMVQAETANMTIDDGKDLNEKINQLTQELIDKGYYTNTYSGQAEAREYATNAISQNVSDIDGALIENTLIEELQSISNLSTDQINDMLSNMTDAEKQYAATHEWFVDELAKSGDAVEEVTKQYQGLIGNSTHLTNAETAKQVLEDSASDANAKGMTKEKLKTLYSTPISGEKADTVYQQSGFESSTGISEDQFTGMDYGTQQVLMMQYYVNEKKAIQENTEEIAKEKQAIQDEITTLEGSNVYQHQEQAFKDLSDATDDYLQNTDDLNSEIASTIDTEDERKDLLRDLANATEEGTELDYDQEQAIQMLEKATGKTRDQLVRIGKQYVLNEDKINAYNDALEELQDGTIDVDTLLEAEENTLDAVNSSIDEAQTAYKSLSTAVDEYNTNGYLSADTLQSVMSLSDAYINTLDIENGKLSLNKDSYVAVAQARYLDMAATYAQTAAEVALAAAEGNDETATLTVKAAAISGVAGSTWELVDSLLAEADAEAKVKAAQNGTDYDSIHSYVEAQRKRVALLKDAANSITTSNVGSVLNPSSSSSSSGSGSDSDSRSQKDLANYDDDFDKFHDFAEAIEEVERSLEKLQDQEDHLFGPELVENLKKQTKELDKQRQIYEQRAAAEENDLAQKRQSLAGYGVTFGEDGQISNYNEATVAWNNKYNEAVNQYNTGVISEDEFNSIEKQYEAFKDAISDYDDEYNQWTEDIDEVNKIAQEIRDNILKQITVQVEYNVDQADIQRQLEEAASDIPVHFDVDGNEIGDFTLQYGKLPGEAESLAKQMYQYTKDDGDIATYKAQVDLYQSELEKIQNGGTSSMFASASEAQNAIDEAKLNYTNALKDAYKLWEEAYNKYLDGIDEGADRFKEIIDEYDDLANHLDHEKTMSELLYGENDYDNQIAITQSQEQNNLGKMDSYRQQAEEWDKRYRDALAKGDEQSAAKFKSLYEEAMQGLYETEEDYIQNLLDEYQTKVKKIFSELEKSLTNGETFDWVSEKWDLTKEKEEGTYDDVERVYQIDKISNSYEKLLKTNSGNLKIQQKIKAQMDAEVKSLEEKEELSEYDVELAEKHLSVLEAEAALEDARNNKNTMKLSRDTSGNWSYQYVADDADIADKEQALADAQNEAYEYAKQGWEEVEEELIQTEQTAVETLEAIREKIANTTGDEKALYEQQLQWYTDYYNNRLDQLTAESAEREKNYKSETMAACATYYSMDADNYELMSTKEQGLVDALKNKQITSASEVYTQIAGDDGTYSKIYNKASQVIGDSNDLWNSSAAEICRKWSTDKESVKNSIANALKECETAQKNFDKKVKTGTTTAGEDFKNLKKEVDKVNTSIDNLSGTTEKTCTDIDSDLNALYSTYETTVGYWNNIGSAALDASYEVDSYTASVAEATQAVLQLAAANAAASSAAGSTGSTPTTSSSPDTTTSSGYTITDGNSHNTVLKNVPWSDVWLYIKKTAKDHPWVVTKGSTIKSYTTRDLSSAAPFDTGGYTGSWGSDGKLGILHQKELVLNAEDTPNILEAVSAVRDLSSIGSNISNAIVDNISNLMSNILTGKVGDISTNTDTNTGNNTFNITAEFPNANDVTEIREAILSLPNLASQYLGRR